MSGPESAASGATAHVRLAGLTKTYGETVAVADFTLDVPRGSFTTLLGPSGCGKTTVLRMVAGFVEPQAGSVTIGGVDLAGKPPNLRGVGMVFQDYALFPHMSVLANVEYGLRMQRVPKPVRQGRALRTLQQLDLAPLAGRYPHQLSGGQQQRVALGRVMVLEPEVLLMDEPLSNLDAKLRVRLRAELKSLQSELGITTLYVTHDQEEALSLSDQLVVMNEGRVQQVGTPEEVYRNPVNRFVAEFVGQANLLPAVVVEARSGGVVVNAAGQSLTVQSSSEPLPANGAAGWIMVRPENVLLKPPGGPNAQDALSLSARVLTKEFAGATERYWLELAGGAGTWLVDAPSATVGQASGAAAQVGDGVTVEVQRGSELWLA